MLDTTDRESGTNTPGKPLYCCSGSATQPQTGPKPAAGLFFMAFLTPHYASSSLLAASAGCSPILDDVAEEKLPVSWVRVSRRWFSPGCEGDCSTPSWKGRLGFPQTLNYLSSSPDYQSEGLKSAFSAPAIELKPIKGPALTFTTPCCCHRPIPSSWR